MKTFIRLVLSEEGLPSSKRVAFFILLFVFLFVDIVNLFTAKKLDVVLQDQLFYAMQGAMLTIFGSNILNKVSELKKVQSSNNAKVGEPSPTPAVIDPTKP
jgi:hypothetical protein